MSSDSEYIAERLDVLIEKQQLANEIAYQQLRAMLNPPAAYDVVDKSIMAQLNQRLDS